MMNEQMRLTSICSHVTGICLRGPRTSVKPLTVQPYIRLKVRAALCVLIVIYAILMEVLKAPQNHPLVCN